MKISRPVSWPRFLRSASPVCRSFALASTLLRRHSSNTCPTASCHEVRAMVGYGVSYFSTSPGLRAAILDPVLPDARQADGGVAAWVPIDFHLRQALEPPNLQNPILQAYMWAVMVHGWHHAKIHMTGGRHLLSDSSAKWVILWAGLG